MASSGGHWVKGSFIPAEADSTAGVDIVADDLTWAEYEEKLAHLQDDTVLRLYHGAQWADEVNEFLEKGQIDPGQEFQRGRIYQAGEREPEMGIHVSPHQHIASGFGPYILEFDAPVSSLTASPMYGLPSAQADAFWADTYPNSARPGVTNTLGLGESQALLVKPAGLRAVWYGRPRPERIPVSKIDYIDERMGPILKE